MNRCHIPVVLLDPRVHVLTEPAYHLEGRRLVVFESIDLRALFEHLVGCVRALCAEIVDLVEAGVLLPEEFLDVPHRVPIDRLEPLAREAHRNDPRCDVREIEIETILHKTSLVPRNEPFNDVITPFVVRNSHLHVDFFDLRI